MTERYRWLVPIRIKQQQLFRSLRNYIIERKLAKTFGLEEDFPFTCKKHQSLLRRKLGDSDPILQENKINNIEIASRCIDGIVIRPGETFSFWKLVGKPTKDKGYIEGMLLAQGEVVRGIGGGICQLANLLYWMALHTPLVIKERHHHSFDPFPDEGRVLPFGSGAGVFYNYVDLQFYNPTSQSFVIRVGLTEKHLKGLISSDKLWPYAYHVEEKNHHFYLDGDKVYRANDIYRKVIDKQTGKQVDLEFIMSNRAEVKYKVDKDQIASTS